MSSDVCHMRREDENPNDWSTAGLHFHHRRQNCGQLPGSQEETFPGGKWPEEEVPYPSRKLERKAQSRQFFLEQDARITYV